mmetsp:Transcript_41325/g.109458  ORF Transcript_41325/g.109458 Transcript_41325/m.109458 type:complete len:244 (-) Transcript_41325:865-1596(-)
MVLLNVFASGGPEVVFNISICLTSPSRVTRIPLQVTLRPPEVLSLINIRLTRPSRTVRCSGWLFLVRTLCINLHVVGITLTVFVRRPQIDDGRENEQEDNLLRPLGQCPLVFPSIENLVREVHHQPCPRDARNDNCQGQYGLQPIEELELVSLSPLLQLIHQSCERIEDPDEDQDIQASSGNNDQQGERQWQRERVAVGESKLLQHPKYYVGGTDHLHSTDPFRLQEWQCDAPTERCHEHQHV